MSGEFNGASKSQDRRTGAPMSGAVNGLYPTKTRVKLLKLIHEGGGRIYHEANHVWDREFGVKVTNRVHEMIGHQWITAEKVTPESKRPGEYPGVVYYRIADAGWQVLREQVPDA